MSQLPEAPKTYREFIARFPKLGEAWESLSEAGQEGPLDAKTQRLIKLAVAIGALKEGPVHASARKALAAGITRDEMDQVVALAAGTLGMPSTVAVWSWIRETE